MRTILSLVQKIPILKSEGVRQAMLYFIAIALLFTGLALADRAMGKMDTRPHLLLFMTVILILGTANNWLLAKPMYNGIPKVFKLFLTLAANMLGAVLFMAVSPNSSIAYYEDLFLPSLLLFSLPWFFMTAFKAILSIPKLEYMPFRITNLRDIVADVNWSEDETKGIVWEFENLSKTGGEGKYWIRTHTPYGVKDIKLKDLFKCLLSLHNHNLSPEEPIHFENGNQYYGWRFFYRTNFIFCKKKKPLNPQKNFRQNGVRFRLLTNKERKEMENLRRGLSRKFRTTSIIIERVNI